MRDTVRTIVGLSRMGGGKSKMAVTMLDNNGGVPFEETPPSYPLLSAERSRRYHTFVHQLFSRFRRRHLRHQGLNALVADRKDFEKSPLSGVGKSRPLILPEVVAH